MKLRKLLLCNRLGDPKPKKLFKAQSYHGHHTAQRRKTPTAPKSCSLQVEVPTMPFLPSRKLCCTATAASLGFFSAVSVQRDCFFRKIKEPKPYANRSSPGKAAKHARPRSRVCAALPCMQRAGRSLPPCRRFHT